jgi:DNA excision repair protein ERCC-2
LERDSTAIAPLQLFSFLSMWNMEGQGVFRSFSPNPPRLKIALLDPAIFTREVFQRVSGAVLMSGTMHHGGMYADLLGIQNPVVKEYRSPFPQENRKIVSVHDLTTRFEERGARMYEKYARDICEIADAVPGNVAAFFPSYEILNLVAEYVRERPLEKQVIIEKRESSKWEKQHLLTILQQGSRYLLMGVQGGSLSEGVDYEKNSLSSIIIAGLPFPPPSLELKALEEYYSQKFGGSKGSQYSRVYPSLNRVLQAVGRCIRSETDRGFIVLMDKRFNYPRYKNAMPQDFHYNVTTTVAEDCRNFF